MVFRATTSRSKRLDGMMVNEIALSADLPAVLIVEDQAILRLAAMEIVEEAGFQVLQASRVSEAIALLEQFPNIGVVFSDIDMPGELSGLDFASLARMRNPNLKFLMTSGARRKAAMVPSGTEMFLNKPYLPEEVTGALRSLIH